MIAWKRMCCAVDFSEPSRSALAAAADLARRLGAELTLLHVYEPPAVANEALVERYGRAAIDLERQLGEWRAEGESRAGRPAHSTILIGKPAVEIERFAREGGFHLLVLGSHGRGGVERLVLGSLAERVLREAPCPVLVVRRPPAEE